LIPYLKEWLVICNKEDTDDRARVTSGDVTYLKN